MKSDHGFTSDEVIGGTIGFQTDKTEITYEQEPKSAQRRTIRDRSVAKYKKMITT